MSSSAIAPTPLMEGRICFLRGQQVMLDVDLAELHQVSKKTLNSAVRRNRIRFPEDFRFQITAEEAEKLMLPPIRGGSRSLPFAFTERGIAMLCSVLQSKRAIELSVSIVRELGRNEEGSLLRLIGQALEPKKKRMGVFTPRAGAVNEY